MTLFKIYSRNFDPSINMALMNGGFLHYTDIKKFLKNLLPWNCWSDFKIISQEYSFVDPLRKLFTEIQTASGGFKPVWKRSSFFEAWKTNAPTTELYEILSNIVIRYYQLFYTVRKEWPPIASISADWKFCDQIVWMHGFLYRFQHYFSHFTAKAHMIHVFPGFHQY